MFTDSQNATLKASILADPSLAEAVANADDLAIAAAYNATASPDYWVWKSELEEREITEKPSVDGTTWNWTAYILRSQAERDCWGRMFATGRVNPSLANVRQGMADIFSGTANSAPAQRTHLLACGRRKASRFEELFAAGGDGSTANPATMTLEGQLSYADVSTALRG